MLRAFDWTNEVALIGTSYNDKRKVFELRQQKQQNLKREYKSLDSNTMDSDKKVYFALCLVCYVKVTILLMLILRTKIEITVSNRHNLQRKFCVNNKEIN